jgi:hypothetical protein
MAIRNLNHAALREWERLEARLAAPGRPLPWRPRARRALLLAGKLGVLAVLPFFVLVRGSVFLYAHALMYLSSGNAKSDQVRAYYGSLHPLLRVALSTWILADRDIVITDVARRPEDYAAMGMQTNDGSLHYVQEDGYIHAVDLRTRGRSEVKNRLVQLYFWTVGLGTLRHVGTGDHLHVELRVR